MTHRRLNWLPGVIESAVPVYRTELFVITVSDRYRHPTCTDDLKVLPVWRWTQRLWTWNIQSLTRGAHPQDCRPPWGKPPSALLQPVPVPVPRQLAHRNAQANLVELPSLQGSDTPTPRAVRTPSPVVRSPYPRKILSDVQMPGKVSPLTLATPVRPLVSRRGRPIIPPRGLMDYVL